MQWARSELQLLHKNVFSLILSLLENFWYLWSLFQTFSSLTEGHFASILYTVQCTPQVQDLPDTSVIELQLRVLKQVRKISSSPTNVQLFFKVTSYARQILLLNAVLGIQHSPEITLGATDNKSDLRVHQWECYIVDHARLKPTWADDRQHAWL